MGAFFYTDAGGKENHPDIEVPHNFIHPIKGFCPRKIPKENLNSTDSDNESQNADNGYGPYSIDDSIAVS
jgi:hypothetical protein